MNIILALADASALVWQRAQEILIALASDSDRFSALGAAVAAESNLSGTVCIRLMTAVASSGAVPESWLPALKSCLRSQSGCLRTAALEVMAGHFIASDFLMDSMLEWTPTRDSAEAALKSAIMVARGVEAVRSVEYLRRMLRAEGDGARLTALRALARLPVLPVQLSGDIVPLLLDGTECGDVPGVEQVADIAAELLLRIPGGASNAPVEGLDGAPQCKVGALHLVLLLRNPGDDEMRLLMQAATATTAGLLAQYCIRNDDAVRGVLRRHLLDLAPRAIWAGAIESFLACVEPVPIDILRAVLDGGGPTERCLALRALARVRTLGPEEVALLAGALDDDSPAVRSLAERTMAARGAERKIR